ncbi:hypothetical protein J4G08_14030 [Candidatus Poribacteria bacterium]|nr:hypothetical protein [Candidatus Poribacteria bacterium]
MATDIFRPERIVPVFDPDATITPQTGTVIYMKNGIVAMAVPLHDLKNVDAFGILIYNRTNHWISYKKEDCQMLDQSGNIVKQLDKSQQSFHLKRNYKPKLPPEFAADVFRYDKTIRVQGGQIVLPTDDYKKTNIMPKNRSLFFIYFPKRSTKSTNLRIIIPRVKSEFNDQQTTFVFKFKVQRG